MEVKVFDFSVNRETWIVHLVKPGDMALNGRLYEWCRDYHLMQFSTSLLSDVHMRKILKTTILQAVAVSVIESYGVVFAESNDYDIDEIVALFVGCHSRRINKIAKRLYRRIIEWADKNRGAWE